MAGFDLNNFQLNSDGSYSKKTTTPQPRDKKGFGGYLPQSAPIGYGKKSHEEVQNEIFDHTVKKVNSEIKTLVFEWQGRHVSLNAWYSNKHWTKSHKITNEWHSFFKKFLVSPYPKFNKYKIELIYNSRLDVSNTITMPKLLEDALQKEGIIENDSKTFCRGISLIPDETMKKFTYKITVINIP